MIVYLKSVTMLFFRLSANIYGLGLSNEQLFIIIGQEDAKLRGLSINYVITSEGGGGCEMMMVDDVRRRGGHNMMMSSLLI